MFENAVGPKPRSTKTLKALQSNPGDVFFQELELNANGETYSNFQKRRGEWELTNKQIYILNAGIKSSMSHIISPVNTYIETFTDVPCAPLTVRSVVNGMRFVQENSIPGSCGEGGCANPVKATAAHDILAMVERTPEASSGAIIIALTSKNVFTERQGLTEIARSDKGRIAVVSVARTTEVRDVARVVLRAVMQLIGFVPCTFMKCIFNDLQTSASNTLDVACPACLRRIACIHGNGEYNYPARYVHLSEWYNVNAQHQVDCGETTWYRERYFSISGKNMSVVTENETTEGDLLKSAKKEEIVSRQQNNETERGETKETVVDPSHEELNICRSKLKLLKMKKRNRRK